MLKPSEKLKDIYETIALTQDPRTTAADFHLRDLEINFALEYIRDDDKVLDVGCGPAVALTEYASKRNVEAYGIDYSKNMVEFANKRVKEQYNHLPINIQQASVVALPFEDNSFDIVTSHRCLMALLDWDLQCAALLEIRRVLKEGGKLILMEGTFDGLERLNHYRQKFGLDEIEADGRDRLMTLKFREQKLLSFMASHYELLRTQRFGMYYFLTRIIQPLFVAPDKPCYDHKLNEIAKMVSKIIPDFDGVGHLVGFSFRKIGRK